MTLRWRLGAALLLTGGLTVAPLTPTGTAHASPERAPEASLVEAFGRDLRVTFTPGTATPRTLRNLALRTVGATPSERAAGFLASSRALLGLTHLQTRLAEVRELPRGGAIVRFELLAGGLEVEGRTLVVKLDAEGQVRTVTSDAVPFELAPASASLPPAAAVELVRARYEIAAAGAPTKVVLAHAAHHARVAWRVPVAVIPLQAHFFVWVDAETGEVMRVAPAGFDQPLKHLPLRASARTPEGSK